MPASVAKLLRRRARGALVRAMLWVCIAAGATVSAKAGQNRTLAALEQRYAAFSQKHGFNLDGPVWRGASYAMGEMGGHSVKQLRSGRYNAYVYQTSSAAHQAYYHAVAAADRIGLLRRTFEDGSFGVEVHSVDGVNVSRDLLDSVSEMLFLHKAFLYRPGGVGGLSVLDVGGGYGRLTKRFHDCWPESKYHVTDGMAISTFLARQYLSRYGLARRVVPLDEVDTFLATTKVDLLVNTHSFPEMAAADVEFWLRRAKQHRVRYLFIVPNGRLTAEPNLRTNKGESISDMLAGLGYRLVLFENFFVNSLRLCWQPGGRGLPLKSATCERHDFTSRTFDYAVPYYLFELVGSV